MAYSYDIGGVQPATGAVTIFRLKEALKAAGWTVTKSSDGTTYNPTGDQITSGNSGAGGMANNSAWFVIKSPSTTFPRQICFQRGTTNLVWRVKYSGTSGYVTGSPTATVVPSAADDQIIFGGGTDASPTFAQLLSTDNTYRMNVVCGGAAENYTFFFFTNINGSSIATTNIFLDVMMPGTYPAADIDPSVINIEYNNASALNSNLGSVTTSPRGWLRKGLSGEGFVRIQGLGLYTIGNGTITYPGGAGVNSFTTNDEVIPMTYARLSSQTSPVGWKGVSSLITVNGVFRASGDTLSVATTKDKLILSGVTTSTSIFVSIPWNGTDLLI